MASFEDRLAALETVVERLERGELTLDESVRLFEEGVGLSNACKAELDTADGKIQLLIEPESDGFQTSEIAVPDMQDAEEEIDEEEDEE